MKKLLVPVLLTTLASCGGSKGSKAPEVLSEVSAIQARGTFSEAEFIPACEKFLNAGWYKKKLEIKKDDNADQVESDSKVEKDLTDSSHTVVNFETGKKSKIAISLYGKMRSCDKIANDIKAAQSNGYRMYLDEFPTAPEFINYAEDESADYNDFVEFYKVSKVGGMRFEVSSEDKEYLKTLNDIIDSTSLHSVSISNEEDSENEMRDILTKLREHTEMMEFTINEKDFDDLAQFSEFKNLRLLDISGTSVKDVSVIANYTELEDLKISNLGLRDLKVVEGLTKLKMLDARDNWITDISPITNLTKLKTLYLSDNRINDVTALIDLKKLNNLSLSNQEDDETGASITKFKCGSSPEIFAHQVNNNPKEIRKCTK